MKENSKALAAGRRIVGRALGWLLIWLAGAGLALWLKSSFIAVALAVAGMWILFSAFTFYFFRDPEPRVPIAPEAVIAPAHGLVDCLDETTEPEFLNGPYRRISIFLSVLDVHVQNAPVAGKIVFVKHRPGRFLSALKTESAEFNESVLIGIESLEQPGERMAVRQIAGVIARRIVSWVGVGDTVARGQRLGLIQFGSRCDLYLPLTARIQVKRGDRVVGGETVVATCGGVDQLDKPTWPKASLTTRRAGGQAPSKTYLRSVPDDRRRGNHASGSPCSSLWNVSSTGRHGSVQDQRDGASQRMQKGQDTPGRGQPRCVYRSSAARDGSSPPAGQRPPSPRC